MSLWGYPVIEVRKLAGGFAIRGAEVVFGDGCFKVTNPGAMLEVVGLDCLPTKG